MAGLLVVGLSHHNAPVEVRERIAIGSERWREVAPTGLRTVLLSTCNRVEVYAWCTGRYTAVANKLERSLARAAGMSTTALRPYVSRLTGQQALLHLVRVAAGLDSLVIGEDQIRGQMREALREAESLEPLPATLRGVFQRAGESARRVRGGTRLSKLPSIAAAAVHVAHRSLPGGLVGKQAVVLGAGVMARAAIESLLAMQAQVRVLNRTPEHARRLVEPMGANVAVGTLDDLTAALRDSALVIGATASRQPLIDTAVAEAATAGRSAPLLMIDIAVPRDIDPRARSLRGVRLLDLDDLEQHCPLDLSARQAELERAEALAAEEAQRLGQWLRLRLVSPAITELRSFAEAIRIRELRRSSSRLRDLTPEQVAAVEALTAGIVNKLLHGPTVALRDAPERRSRSRILHVLRPAPSPSGRGSG
jgi:glutamyl-tRNA reductase